MSAGTGLADTFDLIAYGFELYHRRRSRMTQPVAHGHEIIRRWLVTYESRNYYEDKREVIAPTIEHVKAIIAAVPFNRFRHAREITTPEELAAELERVKPFRDVRLADAAELEAAARTAAARAKARMFNVLALAGTLAGLAVGAGALL